MKVFLYLVPWDKPSSRFLEWAHNGSFAVFSVSVFHTFEDMKGLSKGSGFTRIYSLVLIETIDTVFSCINVEA